MNTTPYWPPRRRDLVIAGVGIGIGIGIGIAVTRYAMRPRSAVTYTSEQQRQLELIQRLYEHTGDPALDPSGRPLTETVSALQTSYGLPPDGRWSDELESHILSTLARATPLQRPAANPAHELEPDDDWEVTYERQFGAALRACCEDENVIAFDQAVTALLEHMFSDRGSFALEPHTGPWKRAARERARRDLAESLGCTEIEVRAILVAETGRRALSQGADFGQAVRAMAERAWPAACWDGPALASWQEAFRRAASATLSPS